MDTKKLLIIIAIVLGAVVVYAAFMLMSEAPDFPVNDYRPNDEIIDEDIDFPIDDEEDVEDVEDEEEEEEEENDEEEEEEEEEE